MPELPDNIGQLGPARAILRGLIDFEILSLNFASVATVTWIVGTSKFCYQYDRIYVVFHRMDSDFQISLLVARESKMNDFWQNFVERHQMTVLI